MDLRNKNIILTGASRGIGQELLKLLCQYEGVRIVAAAQNVDRICECEGKVFPFAADLSTQEGVDRLFGYARSLFNTVDVFIANAGFAYLEELGNADWVHIEKIYSLNVASVVYSLSKFSSQSTDRPLHFVCTISAVAFVPLHAYALYCSSKAALHQFIEAYRYEKKGNMTITAVYPVATKTSFFDKASGQSLTPAPWPQQEVRVVAQKIVRGIEKGKKRVYPSTLYKIFFPVGRTFPVLLRLYSAIEARKTKRWLRKGD